jgi:hypothetical protein
MKDVRITDVDVVRQINEQDVPDPQFDHIDSGKKGTIRHGLAFSGTSVSSILEAGILLSLWLLILNHFLLHK